MNKSKKNIYFIIALGIINLCVLYYYKYSSNQISFSEFSLLKTGNFINFILVLFLILGCIVLIFRQRNQDIIESNIKAAVLLSIVYFFPLFVIVLFNSFDLVFANEYLFGYPFKKILPTIFFVFNQLIFLFIIFMIWYTIIGLRLKAYFYSALSVIGATILFIILTLLYSFWIIEYDYSSEKDQYDYGIILGAAVWSGNRPSPIFVGRIEKGAKLFKQNAIKRIQLTGGNAPGELSEARTAYNYLIKHHDLDSNFILMEEKTSTTNEQIRYIRNNFINEKASSNFLFISDEFHLMRITEMAKFYDLKAKVVSSDYKLNFQKSLYYRFRDSIGLLLFWFFAI